MAIFDTRLVLNEILQQLANIEQNPGEMATENCFSLDDLDEFPRYFRLFPLLSGISEKPQKQCALEGRVIRRIASDWLCEVRCLG